MSIGSVPPRQGGNCVRDVLFENIVFDEPFKAIYIKTNPGSEGHGTIDNIRYSNLTINNALWVPIWIGPQQQHQPGKRGTGCSFLYPVDEECPTQALVRVSNIVIEDVRASGGVLMPGVILCNASNPCVNITLRDVVNTGDFRVDGNYVCVAARGNAVQSLPVPDCF
jgi:polygalacturonase